MSDSTDGRRSRDIFALWASRCVAGACIGLEVALGPVRGRTLAPMRMRGACVPLPAHPGPSRLTHQAHHAWQLTRQSTDRKLRMHSRHSVAGMTKFPGASSAGGGGLW